MLPAKMVTKSQAGPHNSDPEKCFLLKNTVPSKFCRLVNKCLYHCVRE